MPHRFLNRGPSVEADPQILHTHHRDDEFDGFDDEVSKRQDELEERLNQLDPVVERILNKCDHNKPN